MGTSAPEASVSINAALAGSNDIAISYVVGSNIFNILLILGASATIKPIALDITAVYDTLILIVASLIVYLCALSKREIKKGEGAIFLLCYLVFFVYVLTR